MTTTPMTQEPSLMTAGITGGATIVADFLVGFGIPVSPGTKALIIAIISVLAIIIHSVIVRGKVFSPATVQELEAVWRATNQKVSSEPTLVQSPAVDTPSPIVTSSTVAETVVPPIVEQKTESL